MTETDEIYTITLSTATAQTNRDNIPVLRTAGNYSDVSWLINYDSLFKGRQKLFKFCRVRFNWYQGSSTYTWNNQNGYLAANFASKFNSPTTCLPTILGIVTPSINPNNTGVNPHAFLVSTLNEIGVDVNIDQFQGSQLLQLKFCNDDAFTPMSGITKDYLIFLSFQLYN